MEIKDECLEQDFLIVKMHNMHKYVINMQNIQNMQNMQICQSDVVHIVNFWPFTTGLLLKLVEHKDAMHEVVGSIPT